MNPIQWLTRRGSVATTNQAVAASDGFPRIDQSERFEIDLFNGRLAFANPASNLSDQDYWKGFAWDRRPFVNARSGAEFSECPETGRYSCTLYETGWALPLQPAETEREAVLKLSVFLDRPNRAERPTFPDLQDDRQLREWLERCYRDRRHSFSGMEVEQLADGTLAVGQAPNDNRLEHDEPPPLQVLDEPVAGRTALYLYMNPGILECNIARNANEVVQFRFQLLPEDRRNPSEGLKAGSLRLAQAILGSVTMN